MIKELIKLSTYLDERGLRKEADYLDVVIKKIANPPTPATTEQELAAVIQKYQERGWGVMEYWVRAGDTAWELALMALGDATRSGEINEGKPLKVGDIILLPFLEDRMGTTRTNPATGRTLEIPYRLAPEPSMSDEERAAFEDTMPR